MNWSLEAAEWIAQNLFWCYTSQYILWPHSPPPPDPEVGLRASECREQGPHTLWKVVSAGMAGLSEPEAREPSMFPAHLELL
jgi:hypothetical protein